MQDEKQLLLGVPQKCPATSALLPRLRRQLPSLCKGRWHAERVGRVVSYKEKLLPLLETHVRIFAGRASFRICR